MRQNRGQGFMKSTPTCLFSDSCGLTYTTRQAISSPVVELRRVSDCPIDTFNPNRIMAPCAFTVTVRVSSEIGLLSVPSARTFTDTFTMTR